jgi:hypothetical protein
LLLKKLFMLREQRRIVKDFSAALAPLRDSAIRLNGPPGVRFGVRVKAPLSTKGEQRLISF